MKRINPTLRTAVLLAMAAALVLSSACRSTPKEEPAPAPPPSEFDDAATKPPPPPKPAPVEIANVYFDFDKSDIKPEYVDGLRAGAAALKASGVKVVIEGHTDNRGSEEYNLALGERRAASVRRYLANLGVPMAQMTIVSYGELRPAVQGNNETAWAKNRRAVFKAVD